MYEIVSSEVAFSGVMTRVRVDEVAMPEGGTAAREVVETADAVAVVAVDEEGRVVLVRQYRHPLGEYLLELPAGKLDVEGEAPEAAGERELREETGFAAARLETLGRCHNSAGWTTEMTWLYLATALTPAAAEGFTAQHEEADLRVERIPLDEAVRQALDGRITDAKTVVGLLRAAPRFRGTASDAVGGGH